MVASKKKLKQEQVRGKAVTVLTDARFEVAALAEEMGEWRDNLQGTALTNTEKYEQVEESAQQLESVDYTLSHLQLPVEVGDREITYYWIHPYGRHIGRSWRAEGVEVALEAIVELLEQVLTTGESAEARAVRSELLDCIEAISGVEFPGMY